jgi:hypothetical protein
LGCSSSINVGSTQAPNAGDPKSTTSSTSADFDPSTGNIPLPNVLLTGTVTTPLVPSVGVPFTPDKALVWLNQREAGGTNAVSGINSPIYISFSGAVDPATVNANTVKVFLALPDNPADPSSTENNALGFLDVSASFGYQVLPSGKEAYLMPMVPLRPGGRYVYVVTTGVHDPSGLSIGPGSVFKILEYVKAGGTSSANDTTNLADFSDPSNPALLLGPATAGLLEQLAGNVTVSAQIAFSGFRKTMWDLISASASTGITSRSQISVMGRMIINGTGYTKPDPVGHPSSLVPLETLMWAWANNANLSATPLVADFSTAASRQWNNGVTNFQIIGTATIPSGPGSIGNIFGAIPHSHVGTVSWGAYQSADMQMDPATILGNLAVAGGNEDGTATPFPSGTPYNPGTSTVPGSATLMGFRDAGGNLRGYYHTSRTVPFVLITPAAAPGATFKTLIFLHGISRSKEDVLAMADTACAAGYAVVAIDQAVHGYPAGAGSLTAPGVAAMGNGRPQAEWASNFFMLPSSLTARANLYDSAFNLWRLERVLNQPSIDPTSLAAQFNTATGGAYSLNTGPTTHAFVGQSLGSIVGTIFLAGNSSQTGGSNMKALLSVPGARLAFVLHDSPAFQSAVNAGLAAAGIATGSPTYNKFFVLAQSVADSADPGSMMLPLPGQAASRLAGRVLGQEAVGDLVIPNTNGDYWANALGGRAPQLGGDISGGFSQVLHDGASTVAHPFMFGASFGAPFKAAVAASTAAAPATTQGYFQYGDSATPANHGLLLDGSANTGPAQRQMAIWLATGLVADGSDAANGFPMVGTQPPPARVYGPEDLQVHYPQLP